MCVCLLNRKRIPHSDQNGTFCPLTYKHCRTGTDFGPVAFEELDDGVVVEVEHGWEVLDLREDQKRVMGRELSCGSPRSFPHAHG